MDEISNGWLRQNMVHLQAYCENFIECSILNTSPRPRPD